MHFCKAVSAAGKNVIAKKMTLEDFYEWQDYTTQYKLNRLTPRPYVHDIVQVEVTRGNFDFKYITSFDNDFITASIIGNKYLKNNALPPPIKKNKAKWNFSSQKKGHFTKSTNSYPK